ncbi:hypothetical protein PHSY_002228 [Pseudozyma hubeiensis SY62]|uniref:Uncharacterized protein n=1 Tax=Pseudozyma hubeiensis (strain SY62) TaxID=1305764 RepID=R9P979_PSEHS|nr:hypothetical protein PHSY_002228 [Pseudozyma hubeiensis SY62]GAC94655.1 hypothetical protein PHSY_002228 [Pseudozyma hubeiensis SY62]
MNSRVQVLRVAARRVQFKASPVPDALNFSSTFRSNSYLAPTSTHLAAFESANNRSIPSTNVYIRPSFGDFSF